MGVLPKCEIGEARVEGQDRIGCKRAEKMPQLARMTCSRRWRRQLIWKQETSQGRNNNRISKARRKKARKKKGERKKVKCRRHTARREEEVRR